MTGEPDRIEAALVRLTERLAQVEAGLREIAVSVTSGGAPGQLLDEGTRASLEPLTTILELGTLGPESDLAGAGTRLARRVALADWAAVWIGGDNPAGDPEVVASTGPEVMHGAPPRGGVAARAREEGEIVLAGPADAGLDPIMRRQGLTRAVALPAPAAAARPAVLVMVGRRRDVPFDADRLGWLLVLAERLAQAAGLLPGAHGPGRAPGAGRDWSLDLTRVARTIVEDVRAATDQPAVTLLVPEPAGLTAIAHLGTAPMSALAPTTPVLSAAMAPTGPAALVPVSDGALTAWLGQTPRLVGVLRTDGAVAGLVVTGGPLPADPRRVASLLAEAAPALRNARIHAATRAAAAGSSPPLGASPPAPARDFGALLALILGRLGSLRERPGLDQSVESELEVVEEAAWRAAEGVRDLLGYGGGRRGDPSGPADLAEILASAVARTVQRWQSRPGAPEFRLDVEPLPPIRGSATDLLEALEHLLDNAAEAGTEQGSPPVTVRGRWDGSARVEVSVEDRGPGMPDAVRDRAFEPFFTTRGSGRLGLGLPVAQAVVQRHHGELALVTAPGAGTTVRIRLPILAGGPAAHATPEPQPAQAAEPVSVLIVEDEASVREVLVGIVNRLGHRAVTASDGPEALGRLADQPVSAVVTDLALPGGSGLEVAREIQRVRPGTPVIVVTAWPGRLDPASLADSGVTAVVDKPVGPAELGVALRRALGRPTDPATPETSR